MRDIDRIDPFMARLTELWKTFPDLRFGQLVTNFLSFIGRDPFYLEDDEMEELVAKYQEKLSSIAHKN